MHARRKVTHQATVTRALLGLAAAGAVPGALLMVTVLFAARAGFVAASKQLNSLQWWVWPVVGLMYWAMFTLIGALATPVWWRLDRWGWRQWWVAALVGALPLALVMTAVLVFTLSRGMIPKVPPSMWWRPLASITVAAGIGAVMGLIAWRIAYRRAPDAVDVF